MEIKYAVSEKAAVEILRWSRVFFQDDSMSQRVTSLYLDTPTLRFFRWHMDGCRDRFKLRVRGYGNHLNDRLYVEVKRKTDSIVSKERAEIPVAALDAALGATNAMAEQVFGGTRSEALQSFLTKREAFYAQPKMLVRCQRESLRESNTTGEVAVTVDCDVEYQQTSRRELMSDPLAWRSVALPNFRGSEAAIIELKYSTQPPKWMRALMARLAPHRVNFSKYKAAMQQHAEWSNGYVQPYKSGMEYACPSLRVVAGAVLDDRPGLYAC
jgi:hypothetical protein